MASALKRVALERSAPAWKPALDEETGTPFCLTVPPALKRADDAAVSVPPT